MIISNKYQAEAFFEEAQANRYLIFARQAEQEGYPQIAQLFRATAQGKAGLSYTHEWTPGGFVTNAQIPGEASFGETHGLQEIFLVPMVAAAGEGRKKPPRSPKSAADREKTYTDSYREALARLAGLARGDYYVCSKCGYTSEQKRPEKCPHCRNKDITLVKVG